VKLMSKFRNYYRKWNKKSIKHTIKKNKSKRQRKILFLFNRKNQLKKSKKFTLKKIKSKSELVNDVKKSFKMRIY
jgi:hypothetical protein